MLDRRVFLKTLSAGAIAAIHAANAANAANAETPPLPHSHPLPRPQFICLPKRFPEPPRQIHIGPRKGKHAPRLWQVPQGWFKYRDHKLLGTCGAGSTTEEDIGTFTAGPGEDKLQYRFGKTLECDGFMRIGASHTGWTNPIFLLAVHDGPVVEFGCYGRQPGDLALELGSRPYYHPCSFVSVFRPNSPLPDDGHYETTIDWDLGSQKADPYKTALRLNFAYEHYSLSRSQRMADFVMPPRMLAFEYDNDAYDAIMYAMDSYKVAPTQGFRISSHGYNFQLSTRNPPVLAQNYAIQSASAMRGSPVCLDETS